jgi:hypothetical protein
MADYYCPPKALQVALDMLRTGRHRRAAVV